MGTNPNPGAVPPNEVPADAAILWGIRSDGKIMPILIDNNGALVSSGTEYETVAASQTNQAMGATGAVGDFLDSIVIIPATTSPGAVTIKDGANSAITIFTGGATSVADLKPFTVSLKLFSVSGAWQVTTGTNVSAIGVGNFT